MHSAESVHTRFAANPPNANNADHFVCVKYVSGQWEYDNNTNYYAFTPEEGDILVASINFDNDTITSLQGQNSTYYGIAKGYASGNLVYTPDQFGGGYNDGEFTVSGTSFTPNKLADRQAEAGDSRLGQLPPPYLRNPNLPPDGSSYLLVAVVLGQAQASSQRCTLGTKEVFQNRGELPLDFQRRVQ
jgi:hypothetical protein